MVLRTSFDILSGIVDQFESAGRELRNVEVTTCGSSDGALRVAMEVPIPLCGSTADGSHPVLTPSSAAVTDDGGVRVEFTPDDIAELEAPAHASVSAEFRGVRFADGGEMLLTVDLGIDPDDGETDRDAPEVRSATPEGEESRSDPNDRPEGDSPARGGTESEGSVSEAAPELACELDAVRDDSTPPYEDTPYLRRLYETCDTFGEMSRKIEMDVASETVRRYMIEAGIHDPTSYDTTPSTNSEASSSAGDGEAGTADPDPAPAEADAGDEEAVVTEQLVADGEGLPDGLRMEEVVDAVVESSTLFEVQRRLGLDRGPTQELLERLDLLDLVLHRVADGPKRQVSYEEVTTRIRQRAQTGA